VFDRYSHFAGLLFVLQSALVWLAQSARALFRSFESAFGEVCFQQSSRGFGWRIWNQVRGRMRDVRVERCQSPATRGREFREVNIGRFAGGLCRGTAERAAIAGDEDRLVVSNKLGQSRARIVIENPRAQATRRKPSSVIGQSASVLPDRPAVTPS